MRTPHKTTWAGGEPLRPFQVELVIELLQFFAGEENTTFDCTKRRAQLFCDFFVFEAFESHHKRLAKIFRQGIHHAHQLRELYGSFAVVGDYLGTRIQVVVVQLNLP